MSVTDLMWGAWNGDLEKVKKNLSEVGKQDENGQTALMWAAKGGHSNCIPLLEKEIGMHDSDGWTALMLAAYNGKADSIRLLLSEAGSQSTRGWRGFPPGTTALMLAAHQNYPEIVQLLLPYEQGMTDANDHTAQWHANNSSRGGDFSQVNELLKNEGTKRLPPPDPELLRLRRCINELTTENDSLKKDLSSSKNAHEETKKELSQLNREVSSLKQQLDNAIDESKRHAKMNEDLQKASDQNQPLVAYLEKENANRQARIEELIAEKASLQEKLSFSKEALEETRKEIFFLQKQFASSKSTCTEVEWNPLQMNREIDLLKQQLEKYREMYEISNKRAQEAEKSFVEVRGENTSLKNQHSKTIEDSSYTNTDFGALKKALADQKARNLALEKENARLRTESHDMKDLRRRLEEVEEEKRALLQNLAAVGGRLPPAREDSSLISSAIQGDLNTLRRHLDQAG
ncbi:Ankyrin repeat protein 1 [Giardia muris]|uniref:Ankyrin repeat protein 1 n=1 Tax=Giardia muris TaxID=5742 RepID=A0A4Z1SRP5_GIAMU|nr:Ankyrin repeat protein 1 [Giardia muris]|eukprot:TNJ28546.1 Ankyrin repeat protein 1 [Giardia muris]